MIENVIKRDGTIEPFDAEKITRWAEWASPHAQMKRVWPSVVVKVVSRFDGNLTSSKLQESLIEGFLELETDSAYLTAGALYAAHHRKTLYGEQIPTLWEVHQNMRADNLIRDMGYSKEDYAILNAAMKHERDFYVRHYSLLHIRNKYSIKNRVTGKEYETQQFVYMRMAMAIYEHEPEGNARLADVIAQYEVLSKKKLSAPTPNYVNFATYLRSYASCCLYVYGDTGESLAAAEHITYMMTLASAGLGFNLMTRSIADPVRGGLISHQGKLPYLRSAGANSKANLQNGRGGAGNAYVTIFDPEVIKILQLRDVRSTDQNQNRDLHYSIIFNNFYWKCLAENRDIFSWNIYTAPTLHELFYNASSEEFEKEYNRLEADETFKKKYIDIRYLHRIYNNAESNNGVIYRLNINEVNRHTPLNEPIYSSNLCVAPETTILTDKGHETIASLAGQEVTIWNGEQWSTVTVVKTGEDQELWKVKLSNNRELDCTPYHKWYVVDGYNKPAREVRTHELVEGMKLIKFEAPVIEGENIFSNAYTNGFFTGDGTQLYNGKARIYLYGDKVLLKDEFGEDVQWRVNKSTDRLEAEFTNLYPKWTIPNPTHRIQDRLDWFAGLLDADGTVHRNGTNEALVLSSNNREFLLSVSSLLQTLGVQSKVSLANEGGMRKMPLNDGTGLYGDFYCLPLYRLLLTSVATQKLIQLGLVTKRLKVEVREPQRSAEQFVTVKSVEDLGRRDDTYCVTEPLRNMAVFNGILTGQCMEIMEHTKPYDSVIDLYKEEDHGRGEVALCNLAAINVAEIESDEDYAEVMYRAYKMIDYAILRTQYILPHVGYTAKKRMYAAVGLMNLAYEMARNHYSYSSEEGRQFMHEVAERHTYFAIQASLRISRERGLAPWINRTKWVDGWTPVKTYNRNLDKIQKFEYRYDWDEVSKQIKENGGLAHSLLIAHMPGEASSKALGASNCIYPVRDLILTKTDNNIVTRWSAPGGDDPLVNYESAWDMDERDQIIMYAIFNKWSDQGVSADRWRIADNDTTFKSSDIIENDLLAATLGVRSLYYLNTNTSNNVDINKVRRIVDDGSDEEVCESCTM